MLVYRKSRRSLDFLGKRNKIVQRYFACLTREPFKRFISWARYFGLRKTWAPEIIELVEDVRDGRRTFYTATTFPKVPSKKGFGRK